MKKIFIILLILIGIILIVINTANKFTIKPVVNEDNLNLLFEFYRGINNFV